MESKKQISIINIILTIMLVLSFVIGILVILISKYETKVERLAENAEDIKKNYTTTEENSDTWDISKNGDGSVTATMSEDYILTISGTGDMKEWKYNEESDWKSWENQVNVKKVIINEGVTNIGNNAFSECYNLEIIELPSTIINIGNNAFSNCHMLKNIEIPSNVTSIGSAAFMYCKSLTNIEIPSNIKSIESSTFYNCDSLISVNMPNGITNIGGGAFLGCTNLASIEIPSGVTNIGNYAFQYCESLTSIEIPNSVTKIEEGVFSSCSSLTSIHIPSSVINIERGAFKNCTSLLSINIPGGVTKISSSLFSGCTSLTSVEIPDEVTEIEYYAFSGCSNLKSVEMPSCVNTIGNNAFSGCTNLESIELPNSITYIHNGAFSKCSSLKNIVLPEKIWHISSNLFEGCSSLINVEIPENIYNIESYAFSGCSSLVSINLPKNLSSISNYAFYECSSLASIEMPEGLSDIGESAFSGCSKLTNIYIPSKTTSIGNYAFAWCSSLQNIEVNKNNENYMDDNGVLYAKNQAKIIKYPEAKTESEYAILNGTTNIGIYAFCASNNLSKIYIPDSVTSINDTAFYQCEKFSIICKSGSDAESFAKENSINYQVEDIEPRIISINSEVTENTVKVNVEAKDESVGIGEKSYRYYIQEENGEYGIPILSGETYTFTKLKENTKYTIKVEVLDKVGNTVSQEIEVVTLELHKISSTTHIVDEENLIIKEINPGTTVEQIRANLQSDISYEIHDNNGNIVAETSTIGTGYKVKMQNEKIYTIIVTGDCDGDGKITVNKDIIKMNAHRLSGKGLTAEYLLAADADQDGEIKVKDIILINAIRLKQNKDLP